MKNYFNHLLPSETYMDCLAKIFDFNARRDHQNKIPMSVATMSR